MSKQDKRMNIIFWVAFFAVTVLFFIIVLQDDSDKSNALKSQPEIAVETNINGKM